MTNSNFESALNWEVETKSIFLNQETAYTKCKDYLAITRNDTQSILHIAKKSYTPTSNETFKKLVKDLSNHSGWEIRGYNEFAGGKKVLAYLKNNSLRNVSGFEFQDYLVIGNGHDGTTPLFVGTTNIMLRCQNQFSKILKNKNTKVVYHTKNQEAKIKDLRGFFEAYFLEVENLYSDYEALSKVKISKEIIDSLVNRLVKVDEVEEKLSTRKQNLITSINHSIETECKDIGYNLFGLLNGITHYTTHIFSGKNVVGNYFGTASKMNNEAFEFVSELV